MKVRATQLGFYAHGRKRPGQEFDLKPRKGKKMPPEPEGGYPKGIDIKPVDHVFTPEEQFSDTWMEKVEDEPVGKGKKGKKVAEPEPEIDEDEHVI